MEVNMKFLLLLVFILLTSATPTLALDLTASLEYDKLETNKQTLNTTLRVSQTYGDWVPYGQVILANSTYAPTLDLGSFYNECGLDYRIGSEVHLQTQILGGHVIWDNGVALYGYNPLLGARNAPYVYTKATWSTHLW
jgi:hypothetical protein